MKASVCAYICVCVCISFNACTFVVYVVCIHHQTHCVIRFHRGSTFSASTHWMVFQHCTSQNQPVNQAVGVGLFLCLFNQQLSLLMLTTRFFCLIKTTHHCKICVPAQRRISYCPSWNAVSCFSSSVSILNLTVRLKPLARALRL